MKYAEINAIFTNTVNEYISKGYTINTATMGGIQGDIAAIDLRKGMDVLRVRLHKEMAHHFGEDRFWGDCIAMTVGRCTDERIIKAMGRSYDTIWNNELETVEERVFWIMGRQEEWYIEGEEGKAALRKSNSRYYGNRDERHERRAFPGMEKMMLPAIRRHLGKERFPVSKVEEIYKSWSSSEGKYCYYASIGNYRAVKFG